MRAPASRRRPRHLGACNENYNLRIDRRPGRILRCALDVLRSPGTPARRLFDLPAPLLNSGDTVQGSSERKAFLQAYDSLRLLVRGPDAFFLKDASGRCPLSGGGIHHFRLPSGVRSSNQDGAIYRKNLGVEHRQGGRGHHQLHSGRHLDARRLIDQRPTCDAVARQCENPRESNGVKP